LAKKKKIIFKKYDHVHTEIHIKWYNTLYCAVMVRHECQLIILCGTPIKMWASDIKMWVSGLKNGYRAYKVDAIYKSAGTG